jgi:hypothetical protein
MMSGRSAAPWRAVARKPSARLWRIRRSAVRRCAPIATPEANLTGCLLWVAEHNPCSNCRARALKLLIERGTAPESLVRECLHDADGEARELAEAWL